MDFTEEREKEKWIEELSIKYWSIQPPLKESEIINSNLVFKNRKYVTFYFFEVEFVNGCSQFRYFCFLQFTIDHLRSTQTDVTLKLKQSLCIRSIFYFKRKMKNAFKLLNVFTPFRNLFDLFLNFMLNQSVNW